MSATAFAAEAAIRPEAFWLAVDDRLAATGHQQALWTEELSDLYRDGISIQVAVRIVLARRRVKS